MTLAELRQLQALLEKAQQFAKLQAIYTPITLTAIEWHGLEQDCCTTLASLYWAVVMIEKAVNHA